MPRPPRVSRPQGALNEQLRMQYGFLVRRGAAYDAGEQDEAISLAAVCRVLFVDGQGRSVLSQLGARKALQLPDTALLGWTHVGFGIFQGTPRGANSQGVDIGPIAHPAGGVAIADGSPLQWHAPLDAPLVNPPTVESGLPRAKWKPLNKWLSSVAIQGAGHSFTRADLIRVLSNQQGGTHFDPMVEQAFVEIQDSAEDMRRHPEPGNHLDAPTEEFVPATRNLERASMRQVAHEAQRGLESQFGAVLGISYSARDPQAR